MSVANSIMLYGAEVWVPAMEKMVYRRRLSTVQRRAALRVSCSYRTVSGPAILVIAGVTPIHLLAQERKTVFDEKRRGTEALQARQVAHENTLRSWQASWTDETRGRWTARIIPNLASWLGRRFGEVNFYLTQFLSGHGYFREYLHRMGKVEDPHCRYCQSTCDDAQHTFFSCDRWSYHRSELEVRIGQVTPDNIIAKMVASEENWRLVDNFVVKVLRTKKSDGTLEG